MKKNFVLLSFLFLAATGPTATPYLPSSELAFIYESITTTYVDGGIEHTDDWITKQ